MNPVCEKGNEKGNDGKLEQRNGKKETIPVLIRLIYSRISL